MYLNSILHSHTSNQESSTGWARPKINDSRTPNWFIICLLYNTFEFAGIFILKPKKLHLFRDILSIYLPINCTFYWVELHRFL